MALTEEQIRALESCPVLAPLKDWFIAVDSQVAPAPVPPVAKYAFTSYGDSAGEEEYAEGVAKTTHIISNGYVQIKVLENTVEEFIGQTFFIEADADADGTTLYQLYSDAGTTGTGIYVKITKI